MKRSLIALLFAVTTVNASVSTGPALTPAQAGMIAEATSKVCAAHGSIEAIAACVDMVSAIGGLGYIAGKTDALCKAGATACRDAVVKSEDMKLLREWAGAK